MQIQIISKCRNFGGSPKFEIVQYFVRDVCNWRKIVVIVSGIVGCIGVELIPQFPCGVSVQFFIVCIQTKDYQIKIFIFLKRFQRLRILLFLWSWFFQKVAKAVHFSDWPPVIIKVNLNWIRFLWWRERDIWRWKQRRLWLEEPPTLCLCRGTIFCCWITVIWRGGL